MRRRILIGIILAVILIGLTGYFTKGTLTPKVGICLNHSENALEGTLRSAMLDAGYIVLARNGQNDQEKQNAEIKALLQEGVDVLVVQPVDITATAQILQITMETPVIFVGDEPTEMGNAYYVGCDVTKQGSVQVQFLEAFFGKADINGDKCVDYMVVSGLKDISASQHYVQSVTAAMQDYPAVLLEEAYCSNNVAEIRNVCYQAISKYGRDLELILCHNDVSVQGAVAAVQDKGLKPGRDMIILAIGTEAKLKRLVSNGTLTAAVVEDTQLLYDRINQLVNELIKGKKVEQKQYIGYKIWTIDNVNS